MNDLLVNIDGQVKNIIVIGDNEIFYNGKKIIVELKKINSVTYALKLDSKIYEIIYNKLSNGRISLLVDGEHFETITRTALQEKAYKLLEAKASSHHHLEVRAPMPGIILKIMKSVGDVVQRGDSVIILEAMKMENEIKAPASGKLRKLKVSEGKSVEKNSFLFSIE